MQSNIRTYYRNQPHDREGIVTLLREMYGTLSPLEKPNRRLPEGAVDFEQMLRDTEKRVDEYGGSILIADSFGAIIGLAVGWLRESVPALSPSDLPVKIAVIDSVIVTEEARSQGIGKKLMQTMEEHFRGLRCTHLDLQCLGENRRAIDFYESLGFTTRSVLMTKAL